MAIRMVFQYMSIPKQSRFLCIASMIAVSWVSVLDAQSSDERNVTKLPARNAGLPSLAEAKTALRDVWGELAMQQPNGASYEFFKPLIPPPRYVHADFRFYPLVRSFAKAVSTWMSNSPIEIDRVRSSCGLDFQRDGGLGEIKALRC
jgi:hypothetical protein